MGNSHLGKMLNHCRTLYCVDCAPPPLGKCRYKRVQELLSGYGLQMNRLADSSIVLYRNETNKDHSGRFLAERRDLPLCFTGCRFPRFCATSSRFAAPFGKRPVARTRRIGHPSLARFRLFVAPSQRGSLRVVYDIDPLGVGSGLGVVVVVPVPPLVWRRLRVTLWRVLPDLLPAERSDVEVAPGAAQRFVTAGVDEVCAEYVVSVAEEHVVAVPFIDAKVLVEAVGDGVPGHLPVHPRLQARDVCLRRA